MWTQKKDLDTKTSFRQLIRSLNKHLIKNIIKEHKLTTKHKVLIQPYIHEILVYNTKNANSCSIIRTNNK